MWWGNKGILVGAGLDKSRTFLSEGDILSRNKDKIKNDTQKAR